MQIIKKKDQNPIDRVIFYSKEIAKINKAKEFLHRFMVMVKTMLFNIPDFDEMYKTLSFSLDIRKQELINQSTKFAKMIFKDRDYGFKDIGGDDRFYLSLKELSQGYAILSEKNKAFESILFITEVNDKIPAGEITILTKSIENEILPKGKGVFRDGEKLIWNM